MTIINTTDFDYLIKAKKILKEPIYFEELKDINLKKESNITTESHMTPMAYLLFHKEKNALSWSEFKQVINRSDLNKVDGLNISTWHYVFLLKHKYHQLMCDDDYYEVYKKIDKEKVKNKFNKDLPLLHVFCSCIYKEDTQKLKFFKKIINELKEDINVKSVDGATPLMLALTINSEEQNTQVIETLLDYGADLNIRTNEGYDVFTSDNTNLTVLNKILEYRKLNAVIDKSNKSNKNKKNYLL